jgi:hypothetical protein
VIIHFVGQRSEIAALCQAAQSFLFRHEQADFLLRYTRPCFVGEADLVSFCHDRRWVSLVHEKSVSKTLANGILQQTNVKTTAPLKKERSRKYLKKGHEAVPNLIFLTQKYERMAVLSPECRFF